MKQELTFEDALFALGLSRDLMNEKTKEIQKLRKRTNAMQRKLDRYKKYARIKNRKENEQIEKECKKITEFFDSGVFDSGVQVKARFIKTWRAGETK